MFFSLACLLGAAAAASIDSVSTILSEKSLPNKPMLSPYALGERERERTREREKENEKKKIRKTFFSFSPSQPVRVTVIGQR
jgi:hypothetical protein